MNFTVDEFDGIWISWIILPPLFKIGRKL